MGTKSRRERQIAKYKAWTKYLTIVMVMLCAAPNVQAQDVHLRSDDPLIGYLDRMEIRSGNMRNNLWLDVNASTGADCIAFVNRLLQEKDSDGVVLTERDRGWLELIKSSMVPYMDSAYGEAGKEGWWGSLFFSRRGHLYSYTAADGRFSLNINPVLGIQAGGERGKGLGLSRNTRGAEIQGQIGKKIGFYSYLTENQSLFPSNVDDYIARNGNLPGEGFYKRFQSGGQYDYFNARGYVNFSPIKEIQVQFGRDRQKLGNGIRSLLLSDHSTDMNALKIDTRVWRLHYQNLFVEMIDGQRLREKPYGKKYGAFHYLTADFTSWLNIGLFEGVIFYDNSGRGRNFEVSYLNPIIFYRAAEHNLGSSDNALVGMNFSALLAKRIRLYGQIVLDEFLLNEVIKNNQGWWANKYGGQLGVKYVDAFGIKGLDWQIETNAVRPYTYTSDTNAKSYTHYNQPVAHPLGANFREVISNWKWWINSKWTAELALHYQLQGLDSSKTSGNYGGDILRSYKTFVTEYGNSIGQGLRKTQLWGRGQLSYMPYPFLYLDAAMSGWQQDIGGVEKVGIFAEVGLRFHFNSSAYNF